MPKKQRDTSISLHPLSFEEAVAELAKPLAKRVDSEAVVFDSTTDREDTPFWKE